MTNLSFVFIIEMTKSLSILSNRTSSEVISEPKITLSMYCSPKSVSIIISSPSPRLNKYVSLPRPPYNVSFPAPPVIVSFPSNPDIKLFLLFPIIVSFWLLP